MSLRMPGIRPNTGCDHAGYQRVYRGISRLLVFFFFSFLLLCCLHGPLFRPLRLSVSSPRWFPCCRQSPGVSCEIDRSTAAQHHQHGRSQQRRRLPETKAALRSSSKLLSQAVRPSQQSRPLAFILRPSRRLCFCAVAPSLAPGCPAPVLSHPGCRC